MIETWESSTQTPAGNSLTWAGGILLCFAFSLLSFYLLPDTFLAKWSLLAPLSPLLGPEEVTLFRTGTLAFLAIVIMLLFWATAKGDAQTGMLWGATGIYVLLFTGMALLVSLNKYACDDNNSALVAAPLLAGLWCARLCGSAFRTLAMVALLATLQATLTLYDFHRGIHILWSGNVPRAGGTFDQPMLLYFVMISILPFALIQLIRSRSSLALGAWCGCFAVLAGALLLSGMRGGMLAVLVSMGFVVHASFQKWKLSLAALLVAGLLLVGVGFWRSHDAVDAASSNRSNESRLQLWHHAALILAQHPLTGIGVGATEISVETHVAAKPNQAIPFVMVEPKNVLLHWGDELGIGGLLLFGWFGYAIVKSLRGCKDDVSIALGGAWLAMLVAGLTDTPFGLAGRESGNVLIGVFLGATLLYAAQKPEAADAPVHSPARNEGTDA